MLDEVPGPLELRHDAQHREQETQVAGHRLLQRHLALHQLLHPAVQRVDHHVVAHQRPRPLTVAGQEGVSGVRQAFAHEGEELGDARVDLPHRLVEGQAQLDGHRTLLGVRRGAISPGSRGATRG